MPATIHAQPLSPPLRSPTQLHRRKHASTRTTRDEQIIGHVLVDNKRFKCSKPECKELTFGRLADLRRHFDQNHSVQREEYFCRQSGCPRSHNPTGGRSRSFGARKDKRDEHERMVHKRASPGARAYSYSPSERF